MEYRRFGNKIVVRMDRGEDFFEQLRAAALRENVKLAEVSALGTFSYMNAGVYNLEKKQFEGRDWSGMFEIVSLTGTINTMNGQYYSHIHASAADKTGAVFGGHLSRATVGATLELVLTVIDGRVDRVKDEDTGLNIFCFEI